MIHKLRAFISKHVDKLLLLFIVWLITVLSIYKAYGQTKEEVYNYLVLIECKYPDIVLAQSRLETGNYKSYGSRVRHNLFGLWNSEKQEYYKFSCWQESANDYLCKVQYKYTGGDYYKFLDRIGYATDPEYIFKLKQF